MSDIPYDYFNTNFYKKQKPHNFNFDIVNASVFMRGASKRITSTGNQKGDPFQSSFVWPSDDGRGQIKYIYILQSCGPDLLFWDGSNQYMYYDPTNGSTSKGEIMYIDT